MRGRRYKRRPIVWLICMAMGAFVCFYSFGLSLPSVSVSASSVSLSVSSRKVCNGLTDYSHPESVSHINYSSQFSGALSRQDSLIQEMVEFLNPQFKLSKKDKKHIEGRIKGFPHKIVRRDTATYFVNTAYALAYHEFVSHDYKRALKWCDEFYKNVMHKDVVSYFKNYT